MEDPILGKGQYDQSGFLVGPSTDDDIDKAGREIDILRAIHEDTQETAALLSRIADGMGAHSLAPPPDASAPTLTHAEQEGRQQTQAMHAAPAAPTDASSALATSPTEVVATLEPAAAGAGEMVAGAGQVTPLAPIMSQAGPNLAHALAAPTAVDKPAGNPTTKAVPPASLPPRADNGQFKTSLPPTGKPAIADEGVARAEKAERTRQTNGRFGAGGGEREGVADVGDSKTAKAMGAASESLRNAAQGLASGTDNIDPTVQAAKEVAGIVSPLMGAVKPLGRMFGLRKTNPEEKRQRTNVLWFRRIWSSLKDKKGGGSSMGMVLAGLASMLGLLLGPIKALARISGALRALTALAALAKGAGSLTRRSGGRPGARPGDRRRSAARNAADARNSRRNRGAPGGAPAWARSSGPVDAPAGKAAGQKAAKGKPAIPPIAGASGKPGGALPGAKVEAPSKVKPTGKGIGGFAKSLGKKLPYIGALIGLGAVASTAMGKDDPDATDDERQQAKKDRYGTYGGVAGGLLGGAVGMVAGPAGAIAGGMLGDYLGTAVGEWLSTVDMSGMMDSITGAWQSVADGASKMAGDAFGAVKSGWNSLVSVGSGAFTSMTDWARDTWKSATEKVMAVRDTVADKVQAGKDYVSDTATTVKNAGQNVLNTATGGRYTGGSNARKDELIKAMDAGGITDPKSKAALMANVDHESGGFTKSEENLNYSAKRLQQVFPKYYKDADSARADAGNPEAIANKVYGGRMGNTEEGDGYKYRGRGDIQLTGKAQYAAMGKKMGIDLVNNPDLANDEQYRAKIAVQHWKDSGANDAAAAGAISSARVMTNGGTNGMADVNGKYEKYLAQAQAGDLTPTRRADQVQVAAPKAASGAIASTMATVKGGGAHPLPGAIAANTAGAANGPGPLVPGGQSVPGVKGVSGGVPASAPGQPLGMFPIANMASAPANVVAPSQNAQASPAAIKMASVEPIALPSLKMPSYSPPAADASQVKLPATPQVAKPMIGGANKPAPAAQAPMVLNQDVEDRRIAHAATGGLGGSSMGRM